MTSNTYIVGYEKVPGEWHFAGIYPADTPQDAVRAAALDVETSDVFGVIDTALIQTVRVAYRKRVVGIATDPPPDPAPTDPPPAG